MRSPPRIRRQALAARPSGWHHPATDMFVGLVDTRKPEPEPEDEREPLLERIPELRPWRWYLATILCLVVSGYTPAWGTVLLVTAGLCCFFQALTSYYQGNDGMRGYRQ
jgi:hypothetical protein